MATGSVGRAGFLFIESVPARLIVDKQYFEGLQRTVSSLVGARPGTK